MGLYTYPDISVVCGAAQFEDSRRDTLLNPTVLAEVLSPSTENCDRGQKFQRYRALSSLAEYVLIAQDAMHVEHYARQHDGRWLLTEADGPEGAIHLAAMAFGLVLADVYAKVDFEDKS